MQKLIIGKLSGTDEAESTGFTYSQLSSRSRKETFVYKEVDDIEIAAEV
jgi:hypothetical protein